MCRNVGIVVAYYLSLTTECKTHSETAATWTITKGHKLAPDLPVSTPDLIILQQKHEGTSTEKAQSVK